MNGAAGDRGGLGGERGAVLLGLMLSNGVVALNATVVATAVPSIVDDIGGLAAVPWLFSVYLLGQAVTSPLSGKVSDSVGRRPVLLVGIGLFLVGSLVCAIAGGMVVLVLGRAVQGIAAGAVQPMAVTVLGDLYTLAERARAQGYLASVWGISSIAGPLVGGVIVTYVSWRWIFVLNVPLCVVAGVQILRRFRERVVRTHQSVDVFGALLLTLGWGLVLLALLEGGQTWRWTSPASAVVVGSGVVLLAVFLVVELRVQAPVVPPWVFRRRVLVASAAASFGIGGVVIGLSAYVPLFAQTSLGAGPVVAGLVLACLTLGWPISSSQSGKIYLRFGFRATCLLGSLVVVLGSCALLMPFATASAINLAAVCLVIGIGIGFVAGPALIAAQSSVEWADRGTVSANNLFSRALGSAVGAAVLGATASAAAATMLPPHIAFLGVVGFGVVMLTAAIAMPGQIA